MGVTTYFFVLVFIPAVMIGWRMVLKCKCCNHALPVLFLAVISLWFIGSYDYRFVLCMLATVTVNYYTVRIMKSTHNANIRKGITALLVIANLSILLILKYANWIRELFWEIERPWNLILPIGISFYTLEQIMYIVDNGKGGEYDYSFIEYLSYSTFFPVIVSGPIMHHAQYMEQLQTIKRAEIPDEKVKQGMISFSLGYGKKLLLASQLGRIVDFGYGNIETMSTWAMIVCIISYALQLYFDFSGYCNIVEGIGLMMGFDLPINFVSPYKAASIGEFWKRWHKTLTAFLTKYVYIPLGGNRKGKARQAINIMIVFLVSGLWHGASLTFLVWGGAHGLCMVIDKYIGQYWSRTWLWLRRVFTFMIVSTLWIPFRAESLHHTVDILRGLGNLRTITSDEFYQTMLPRIATLAQISGLLTEDVILMAQKGIIWVFILLLLWIVFWAKDVTYLREKYCDKIWMMYVCGGILSLSVMQLSEAVPTFIYEGF